MSEFLEPVYDIAANMPQFVVSPPDYSVIQQGLALINSEEALLPQMAGLDPLQQFDLLEQWYAMHDPSYLAMDDYDDLFMSMPVEEMKKYAVQGARDWKEGISAALAAEGWKASGGQVSATGAAIAGERIAYDYATSLAVSSSGSTSAMAVLSMNLPTAAAAMAPLIGFALGWTLYELSPEFWTKISRALLPFCYEDTELMPVMADDKGNTYFPVDAVQALSTVFESASNGFSSTVEGIPFNPDPFKYGEINGNFFLNVPGYSTEYRIGVTDNTDTVYIGLFRTPYYNKYNPNPFHIVLCSSSPFRERHGTNNQFSNAAQVSSNGKVFYSTVLHLNVTEGEAPSADIAINWIDKKTDSSFSESWHDIEHAMIYNSSPSIDVNGVSKWKGLNYPTTGIEQFNILGPVNKDKKDYDKIPYIPIATPYGRPGESVPSTVTDLTKNPEPDVALDPWISPKPDPSTYPDGTNEDTKPAPLPSILPTPTPAPNPQENPSTKPEANPQPDPNAPTPGDSGASNQPQNPDSIPFLPGDGIVHVYNPTADELRAFGSWLWRTFSGDIIETVSKLFNNPMDSLIGLHELYASPNIAGTDNIKCGYLTSDIASKYVGNRYSTINCGSIVVPEYYNNYLDYSPYTKCFIYLPFVGIVPVHADDIVGNAINITYNVDAYTGSCIAIISVAREGYSAVVYQFQGNCAAELPISSGYHSALMAGLLGVAGTAISGNPHVGLSAANLGRASLGKNEVTHSGSFGATYGAMGAKAPYIIVKRPTQRSVVNYNQDYGFPAHKRVTIGACTGYLRAREVHVISPTATDEEKARIEELLKTGVFVQ